MKRLSLTVLVTAVAAAAALSGICLSKPGYCHSKPQRSQLQKAPLAHARIAWEPSFQQALEDAKKTGKPLMVDFFATWCPPCHMLETQTYTDPGVIHATKRWIPARVDVNKEQALAARYGISGLPTVVFMRSDGTVVGGREGFAPPREMLDIMKQASRLVNAPAQTKKG